MSKFKYPVDTDQFQIIREQGLLYVDKTDLMFDLANRYRYVFLARPRRFGKSLLCNTFKAYFQGQKELFNGLKVMKLEKEWTKFPVLHFDMSELKNCTNIQSMRNILSDMIARYEEQFGAVKMIEEEGARFRRLLEHIYSMTIRSGACACICRRSRRGLRTRCPMSCSSIDRKSVV